MEIDIRSTKEEEIEIIRFASDGVVHNVGGDIFISTGGKMNDDAVKISTKEDAQNLKLAIDKALSMNWWDC